MIYKHIEKQVCDRLPKLRAYVISKCGRGEQAEDICSETIVRIWEIIRNGKFKKGHSIDSFMWHCARSILYDFYRRNAIGKRIYEEHSYCLSKSVKSPEKKYELSIENELFLKKLEQLKTIYRKILILLLFQNMEHWEIANTLNIPRGTVSCYILRMRKKFGDIHLNKVRIQCQP